ncbi:hypothetical protein ABID08_004074 [Rhizobium binae]|uniref:Uncharacterized protein n=1 Tax=Rhizobium binae TaxID=1138190 RepID=A0ABV2MJQ9_9HYPH
MISRSALAERWGELADFLGDDGETLAGLAGTRRLDADIQRQQVCCGGSRRAAAGYRNSAITRWRRNVRLTQPRSRRRLERAAVALVAS